MNLIILLNFIGRKYKIHKLLIEAENELFINKDYSSQQQPIIITLKHQCVKHCEAVQNHLKIRCSPPKLAFLQMINAHFEPLSGEL